MATRFQEGARARPALVDGSLSDAARAIIGPRADALLLWGAPLIAFLIVQLWLRGTAAWTPSLTPLAVTALVGTVAVLTFAHLIAVVPRAYFNREVFAAYRLRLTLLPALLIAALLLSPTALVVASIVSVLWDVHHSAMQNFGFARLYDMKAGNPPAMLRAADLRLNWVMYVGPLVAGAALGTHFTEFPRLDGTALSLLTRVPGILQSHVAGVRHAAIVAYVAVLGWTAIDYARAMGRGYRLPAHKAATMAITGIVSILAWGFSPPLIALAAINLYHAVQYFALVWVKEGGRMRRVETPRVRAALVFGGGCMLFGLAYAVVGNGHYGALLAPFVAWSLLHFWYDGFVWSVRRRQV